MNIRVALLIGSLLVLAMVAAVVAKSTQEEWKIYQREYYELATERATSDTVRDSLASAKLEIKQDVLMNFGDEHRVDRCRTCHMAIDDPAFVDGENPLRTHPEMPQHAFNEFGCTICHEGDGRALTKEFAHGEDHFWDSPLLTGPYVEASCARCHADSFRDETPHLSRGRQLFDSYGCGGCHFVDGVSRGKLAPDLSEAGHHFKVDYLEESVRDPKANDSSSVMPRFKIGDEDIEALVVYMKSMRGHPLYMGPVEIVTEAREWDEAEPAAWEVSPETGQLAFVGQPCLSCHKLGHADGEVAPELTYEGLLRDPEFIAEHIRDPRLHNPGSSMPNLWMSETEREAIALYLGLHQELEIPADSADQYQLLCSRCHGEAGDGNGLIADNLLPRPRVFTNDQFFNWLPEERAYANIAYGVPGTAMPPYHDVLTDAEIEALFAWVRADFIGGERPERSTTRKIPDENPTPYSAESVARGKEAFELRCYGCHGRAADGFGPNAADMLPRPRDLTNTAFIGNADDARLYESITYGIVGTGMPPWDYLPESQRGDLINYIRSVSETGAAANQGGNGHE